MKIIKNLLMSFILISSFHSFAAEALFKVVALKEKASFNGDEIELEQEFTDGGTLSTEEKSMVKIYFIKAQTYLTLGPSSSAKVEKTDSDNIPSGELVNGSARWLVQKVKKSLTETNKKNAEKFIVKTKNTAMGVRGTDFYTIYNPLLGESEIVVFEGRVRFARTGKLKNEKMVKTGQWGGVGGRFGKKIGPLINLPANVLEYFSKSSYLENEVDFVDQKKKK